jgi:hypothetical protein
MLAPDHNKMTSLISVQSFRRCVEHQKKAEANTPSNSQAKQVNTMFPPLKEFAELERTIRRIDADPESPTAETRMKTPSAAKGPKIPVFENEPLVILEFDEAHTMAAWPKDPEADWSNFSELRRTLRSLKSLSLFSLFLSNTGKINQFVPSPRMDRSTRIMRRLLLLFPPFTDLGFDQLAKKVALDGRLKIDDITSDNFIAHFGRPMYISLFTIFDYALLNISFKVWCSI